jgi:hypothetical protein
MANPSNVISIDAPVEGWNAFDGLDNMPPTAAIILDNLIPKAGHVDTREGYIEYIDLETGEPCQTVASFNSNTVSRLIAVSGGGMWDITDTEITVAAVAIEELAPVGTFEVDKWQHRNFRQADEEGILIMCNGTDNTQIVSESGGVPALVLTDMIAQEFNTEDPPVLEDIPSNFIGVEVFKGRCYYWYDNDDAFYYTNAGAYQGELSRFPLGAFIQLGGKLMMIATWTQQDSGDGKDDFIVFVFSTGEVLIYQGDDPGGVGFFEMVGRYNMAPPLGIRCKAKYGSDIIISTQDGYVGLSSIIQQGRTSDVPQFSRLIHTAIVDQVARTSHLYGWDTVLFAKKGLMLFNVPITDQTFEQHVLNTVTQRWCRFTNLTVNCLEVHDDRLFGGTNDGKVLAMLERTSDNNLPISFTCLYAFNYLGNPGIHKHVTAAQVLTTHSAPEYIQLTGYSDYEVPNLTPVYQPTVTTIGTWSINPEIPPNAIGSFWDADYWGRSGTPYTYKGWQNISAFGYSCALLVRFAKLNEGVRWRSTTLRYNEAGSQ